VTVVAQAVVRARSGLKDPNPSDWIVHLPRTNRGGKNRTGTCVGRIPVRRRALPDPHRHVGVSGKHTVARLIGAPPGYVGYEEGGPADRGCAPEALLCVVVRRDRKAHHDVFNVMLQILDDGRLTDGQGRVVDFKNTIIVMTSNIGSQRILQYRGSTNR